MNGTFEILPPNKHFPKFKRCKISFGPPISISDSYKDLLLHNKILNPKDLQEIAFRIMDEVRCMAKLEWDESVKFNHVRK